MTHRLYYDNTYLKSFEAIVQECVKKDNNKYLIRLNRSAFYPTSGGQPYDTGMIGNASVSDVFADDFGEVWHETDIALEPGALVDCEIDWCRRFDHMQQHAGEHMLANAAYRILGGSTIGLHLGSDVSSIDMTLPEGRTHITKDELMKLEDDVNSRIQRDVVIKQWFPDNAELAALPMRKTSTVTENVRVVQIGELEFCPCGGTHPSSAGQIGLFKIVDARPSRGKLRISFVCGTRAFNLLRDNYDILHTVADSLSTAVENVPSIVKSMDDEIKRITRELSNVRKELLLAGANTILEAAAINSAGVRVASAIVEGDVNSARELALYLSGNSRTIAVIGVKTTSAYSYIVSRSADTDCACGDALSAAAKRSGGKGGGKPDFAQGGGPIEMLEQICSECSATAK